MLFIRCLLYCGLPVFVFTALQNSVDYLVFERKLYDVVESSISEKSYS